MIKICVLRIDIYQPNKIQLVGIVVASEHSVFKTENMLFLNRPTLRSRRKEASNKKFETPTLKRLF